MAQLPSAPFAGLVLGLVLLAPASRVGASGGDHQWSRDFAIHGFDRRIRAAVVFEGMLVAGGDFTRYERQDFARVAILDGDRWSPFGDGFDDAVYALRVWNGELYAGGSFRNSGARPVSSIARWDGAAWQEVGGGLGGRVFDFTTYDGDLVVAGDFDEVASHRYVTRWDGSDWKPFPINPIFGNAYAVEVYWGKLYAGGTFDYGRGIARWSGDQWDVPGGSFSSGSRVYDLMAHAGELWAVGRFTKGDARNVATWVDHQEWSPVGSALSEVYEVACIDTLGGQVHVSGRGFLDRWDGVRWVPEEAPIADGRAYTVRSWNGRLFVGGERYSTAAGTRGKAMLVDGNGWEHAHAAENGPNAAVHALAVWDGRVVVAGSMTAAGTSPLPRIGAWDGTGWRMLGDGLNGPVRALLVHDGALWAGGSFNGSGFGILARRVARWNGTVWEGLGPGFEDGQVQTLAVHDGAIVAGGTFTASAGREVGGVGAWDGAAWQARGSRLGNVRDLLDWGGWLVAAGDFELPDGVSRNLGRWNGADWENFAGTPSGGVTALEIFGGDLVAAGAFTQIDGQPLARIARWDGNTWQPFAGGFDQTVWALTVWNGSLVAGGAFGTADGAPLVSLARWDGVTWQPFGSGASGTVVSLLGAGPELWAAGALGAGGLPRSYLAHWRGPEAGPGPGDAQAPLFRDTAPAPIVLRAWPSPAPAGADQSLGFSLPARSDVTLTVHDVTGRLVRTVTARGLPEGRHSARWDGRDDAGHRSTAGVYFVRLVAAGESVTHKIVRVD